MKHPEQITLPSTGPVVRISNNPCSLETLSEVAKKMIARAQRSPVGEMCVPVNVTITGGTYTETPNRNKLRPWDVVGEYSFDLFEDKGRGNLAQHSNRYNLMGDGRVKRLKLVETGNDLDEAGNLVKRTVWVEDTLVHGVDANITRYVDQQTGTEDVSLNFVSLPKPGQWKDADRPRQFLNSKNEPIPFLKNADIIF